MVIFEEKDKFKYVRTRFFYFGGVGEVIRIKKLIENEVYTKPENSSTSITLLYETKKY